MHYEFLTPSCFSDPTASSITTRERNGRIESIEDNCNNGLNVTYLRQL